MPVRWPTLIRLWLSARERKRRPGLPFRIGDVVSAQTRLNPYGYVECGGEIWPARTDGDVAPGARVRVIGAEGTRLVVGIAHESDSHRERE